MKITLILLLTLFSLTACVQNPTVPTPVQQKTTSSPPILQINPGGHKAKIKDIVYTPDGKYLVSASDDKLIRVWDIETGKTVRTIRGQIGEGHEGKIFAMAMSLDGKWLAVGGFMAPRHGIRDEDVGNIRLYNYPTGKLVALLKGHTDVVLSLAFSPNSHYLISGSGDFNAIIWNIKTHKKLHTLSNLNSMIKWDILQNALEESHGKRILLVEYLPLRRSL